MKKRLSMLGIIGASFAMAIAVGASLMHKGEVREAKATEVSYYTLDGTITGGNNGYATESAITQNDIRWKVTGNTTMSPWRIGGKSITGTDRILYSLDALEETTTKVTLTTGTASDVTVNSLKLVVSTDEFETTYDEVSVAFSESTTLTFNPSTGKEWTDCYFKVVFNLTIGSSTKFVQLSALDFYKELDDTVESLDADNKDFEVGVGKTKNVTITYSGLTNNIGITGASDVVSVPATLNVTGSGTTTLSVQGSKPGSVTLVLSSGDASVNISVKVFAVNTYTKIVSNGQLIGNQKIVIAKVPTNNEETTKAIDISGGSNNRNETIVDVDGDNVSTASSTLAVITLEKDDNDYLLKDDNSGSYYIGAEGQNYLKLGLSSDAGAKWTITIGNDGAIITCKASSRYIRYNSTSKIFATYGSGQSAVNIYMAPSDIPQAKNITSITAPDGTVEAGSNINYVGTYLPADATETVVVEVSDSEKLTVTQLVVSGGNVAFNIAASESIETETTFTVTLKAADHQDSKFASGTITVTVYSPTHNRINSNEGLYNGASVIFGNSEYKLAAGAHNLNGNNIAAANIGFASDGSSLSNASGDAKEYTMWQVNVGGYTGWAFYYDGFYLVNTDTADSNVLQKSSKLTANAVFSISISEGVASIISVKNENTENNSNKMLFNKSAKLFSCYKKNSTIGDTYVTVSLYIANAKSDSIVAGSFENFFMHMDSVGQSEQGNGQCLDSKGAYYSFAKTAYGGLTAGEKSEISDEALARMEAWAIANGETFDSSSGTFSARINTLKLDGESNSVILIIVLSSVAAISLGFVIALKKKKHN